MKERAIQKLSERYPSIAKILGDGGNRAIAILVISLMTTFVFVIYNAVLAVKFVSSWNIVLGGYYVLLLASKIAIVFGFGVGKKGLKYNGATIYLLSGIVLFVIHTPLVILVNLLKENAFTYPGVLVYIYALYAFYKIISAIVNFVKTKKNKGNLINQSLRNVNLADAMVSILALQTALIYAKDSGGSFKTYANVVTGGVVCGFVLIVSIIMIVRAIVTIVKDRRKQGYEQREREK